MFIVVIIDTAMTSFPCFTLSLTGVTSIPIIYYGFDFTGMIQD